MTLSAFLNKVKELGFPAHVVKIITTEDKAFPTEEEIILINFPTAKEGLDYYFSPSSIADIIKFPISLTEEKYQWTIKMKTKGFAELTIGDPVQIIVLLPKTQKLYQQIKDQWEGYKGPTVK